MTITEVEELAIPEDTSRSRLTKTTEYLPPADSDDFTTADDRLKSFWRKYKTGRVVTKILTDETDGEEEVQDFAGNVVHRSLGVRTFTVTAYIFRDADDDVAASTAHATRTTASTNPVTAEFPQEVAETAAISRALRFLGIRLDA